MHYFWQILSWVIIWNVALHLSALIERKTLAMSVFGAVMVMVNVLIFQIGF
jgi:hypothetical protein